MATHNQTYTATELLSVFTTVADVVENTKFTVLTGVERFSDGKLFRITLDTEKVLSVNNYDSGASPSIITVYSSTDVLGRFGLATSSWNNTTDPLTLQPGTYYIHLDSNDSGPGLSYGTGVSTLSIWTYPVGGSAGTATLVDEPVQNLIVGPFDYPTVILPATRFDIKAVAGLTKEFDDIPVMAFQVGGAATPTHLHYVTITRWQLKRALELFDGTQEFIEFSSTSTVAAGHDHLVTFRYWFTSAMLEVVSVAAIDHVHIALPLVDASLHLKQVQTASINQNMYVADWTANTALDGNNVDYFLNLSDPTWFNNMIAGRTVLNFLNYGQARLILSDNTAYDVDVYLGEGFGLRVPAAYYTEINAYLTAAVVNNQWETLAIRFDYTYEANAHEVAYLKTWGQHTPQV